MVYARLHLICGNCGNSDPDEFSAKYNKGDNLTPNHFLERSELLKTFSTWQEAVNSPEFKGERHD